MKKLSMLVDHMIPITHQEKLVPGKFPKRSLGILMTINLMKGTHHTGMKKTQSQIEC